MSGSDLAPFVAAVFEDGAVAGLLQENNELKNEIDELKNENNELKNENNELQSRENKRLVVQITGVDGTPIYGEESFRNAERYDDGIDDGIDDEITLDFDTDGSSDGFPFTSLGKIEIRFGGVVVQQSNIDDLIICFQNLADGYDEENRMDYITLHHTNNRRHLYGPIICVHGRIGPLPLGWGLRNTGDEDGMVLTDFLELVADENNDLTPQTLIINGLVFDEKAIPGLMSLIEK